MSTVLAPWPVCPPPHEDESLHSWFERVAAFYGLTAHRMLNSVSRGLPKPKRWSDAFKVGIALAGNRKVARRLIALGGLSPSTFSSLRPARTGWELPRQEFRTYCPRCCLEDLHRGEMPYGRLVWQQAWYTVCRSCCDGPPRSPVGKDINFSKMQVSHRPWGINTPNIRNASAITFSMQCSKFKQP